MSKGKLMKITAVFFVFMLCFTVLSRAADQMSIAVVTTARPENKMITHEVKVTGKVVQNRELAVTTEADQRVKTILVSEGDRVAKGDVLFEIDTLLLEEKILEQRQEMEKQELQVKDVKSQKDVSAQQKASQQAQAQEQYALSTQSAGVRLSRAKQALADAKKELKKFRSETGTGIQDDSVEDALTKACEEKADAYILARQELVRVQWKIENAVNLALQNAKSGMAPQKNDSVHTQSAEESFDVIPEESGNDAVPGVGADDSDRQAASSAASPTVGADDSDRQAASSAASPTVGADGSDRQAASLAASPAGGTEIQPYHAQEDFLSDGELELDVILPEEEGGGADNSGSTGSGNTGGSEVSGNGADSPSWESGNGTGGDSGSLSGDSGSSTGGMNGSGDPDTDQDDLMIEGNDSSSLPAAVTQAELDAIEQSVRDSYRPELDTAQKKVDTALAEKNAAETALMQYQQERMAAAGEDRAQAEKQLIANVTAAQQAYEDAALAANEAAVTSGRAVQQAGIPDASNSSDRMNEITYEQMELRLEKLERLKENGGKVTAPADGLITKISIMTGEKTSDTTAILMADLAQGYRFTAQLTKEQEKYIGTGDLVTLEGGRKQKLEELPVESVTADEEDDSIYHVTVQIPEDTFEIGMTATLQFAKKSEAYPVCVPLSALHLDEKNQAYVLVPDEYDSIMGTEIRARRVGVTVQEKNESYAALAEGALSSRQEVIISSDKTVDEGSRVRTAG